MLGSGSPNPEEENKEAEPSDRREEILGMLAGKEKQLDNDLLSEGETGSTAVSRGGIEMLSPAGPEKVRHALRKDSS